MGMASLLFFLEGIANDQTGLQEGIAKARSQSDLAKNFVAADLPAKSVQLFVGFVEHPFISEKVKVQRSNPIADEKRGCGPC